MKKVFLLAIALMVIASAASANLFDPNQLVEWNSPWGGGFTWDLPNLTLQTSTGSFGWYQAIATTPGVAYTITANWQGNGDLNWCEVLLFNDDGRTVYDQLDAPLDSSIISKVDGWGLNGGMPFGPGPITNYYFPNGPLTNTVVATGTTMFLGLKTGSVGAGTAVQFTDIVLVPEPCTMVVLAAGLGGLLIRRRR